MIALSLDPARGLGNWEPDGAVLTSSLPTSDEILDQALELSARLEARKTDIAAWGEFLEPQPESLAAQAERIMAQARSAQHAAAEALRGFLTQHRIAPQELNERRPVWLASRRPMAPPAFATASVSSDAAPSTNSIEVMKENWRFIAAHVPGLIAPRVLKRALGLADALLAAEARLPPRQGRHARRRYAIISRWATWKRRWAVAARDAAERKLYDYLEHSGMHDRMCLSLDYLMEAWKRALAQDIQLDKAPGFLDAAGALAARVRTYLDHWAQERASKPEWPMQA